MTQTEKRKRLQALRKASLKATWMTGRIQMEVGGDLFGQTDSGTGCGLLDNANSDTNSLWDGHFVKWSDVPAMIPENFEIDVYVYSITGFGEYINYELEFNIAMNIGDANGNKPYFRTSGRGWGKAENVYIEKW